MIRKVSPIDIEGIYKNYLDKNKKKTEKKDMKEMNIGIMHQAQVHVQGNYILNQLRKLRLQTQ